MSILDGDLATALTDALIEADIPQSAVVTTQEVSGPPWEPVITDVPHSCSGWVDEYSVADRANGDVLVTDRRIYIIASTLSVTPAVGNTVAVNGGVAFTIVTVQLDPAGACWVIQART